MKTYILQFSSKQNRTFIDTKLHLDSESKDQTQAESWLQAKFNFGYPLTSIQEYLLDNQ